MSMALASDDTFSRHMETVARKLLGDPNKALSSANELRFGTQGSLSVDLEKGVWSDHEAKEGGGVLDFLKRELGLEVGAAIDWLRDECGADIEDRREPRQERGVVQPMKRIAATYDYIDENGDILFQVCRFEPKDFRQRRPDPSAPSGWNWSVKGVRQVPYRLHDLTEAAAMERTCFIVEGEKDADALAALGVAATCNAGGAGKWPNELTGHFRGADVVILPDNDPAGRNHAALVGAALKGVAERVRVLDLPGLPPKGDPADWAASGGDAGKLHALVEREARDWRPERPTSAYGAVPWSDIGRVKVIYRPLIKGMIFEGDGGMLFGESGSGKSFLAVDAAVSVARGVPFLGMKTTQGPVIYQAGEGGRGLLRRLEAYRQEHSVFGDLPFELLPEKVNLFARDGDAEAFEDECVAWRAHYGGLALIVIDTFSAASTGANENAGEDMGRMLDVGDRLQRKTGAAVLWVHHKNAAGLRERGHTSFRANIETVAEVTKDPETNERSLRLVKLKDGEDGWIKGFELQSVELGTDDDGDPITSCVVRPVQVGGSGTGKKQFLPRGQFNFIRVLDDAIRQRGGLVPMGGEADVGTYGVEYPHFRDLYKVLCGAGKEPGAIRTAISRDGDALWRGGFIGRHNEWFWITKRGELQIGGVT